MGKQTSGSLSPIEFDVDGYRAAGRPFYLNSGEFHYFRVPRKDWRRRMRLLKAAGGNCVATYIPWLIHEPDEGRFLFGGRSGIHDVEGFLETAADEGFYVIARPGPYQYSELKYAGLPAWLCEAYPRLHALNLEGKPFRVDAMSYLHPRFLDKVRRWFDAVCPRIAPFTTARGGPVAMVQFDNELGGIQYWFGSLDYNAETMGFGDHGGRYPRFLAGRYGTIAKLNEHYGTAFKTFADARPMAPKPTGDPVEVRRLRDYFQFYVGHLGEYGGLLIELMRERGIEAPFVHNSGGAQTNMGFKALAAALPGRFVLGADHYYNLGPDWPQNNPTPQHAVQMFCSLEMLRLMGFPPSVWELPAGSMADWPPITAADTRACYLMNLAFGMKGSNYYIFTGGPNVAGTGITADIYDYGAPIGPRNEVRPHYQAAKDFGLLVQRRPWLEEARREHDVRVAFDEEFPMASQYWGARGRFALTPAEAWTFAQKGLLSTAFCAGLSPVLVDLDGEDWVDDVKTPVVVVGSSCMARSRQERVVRFIKGGGRVLLAPVVPAYDEALKPCTVLADLIGRPRQVVQPRYGNIRVTVGRVANIWNNGEVWWLDGLAKGAEIVGTDEVSGKPLAALWRFAGGGRLVVLGFRWSQAKREHERMLTTVLRSLGLAPKVRCSNPNVWTSLRTAGNRSALFLMNLMSAPMEAEASCRPAWSRKAVSAGRHRLPAMSVKVVELKPE